MSVVWNGWVPSVRWTPTSPAELERAEKQMLQGVRVPFEQKMVKVGDHFINTIKTPSNGPPLVLIHGFGAGLGFWSGNIDMLSKKYTVYAIDLLGFGRSGRPKFKGTTSDDAENMWVSSIDQWADEVGLEKFVLLGHSLGGYISTCYTMKHPQKISHLILADPWGVPPPPPDVEEKIKKRGLLIRIVGATSLSMLRWAGPYGPSLIARFRHDIAPKFQDIYRQPEAVVNPYIYHLNSQTPATGEDAFRQLTTAFAFAKNPLINRIQNFPPVPTTFIYGSHTWMDRGAGKQMMSQLKGKTNYIEIAQSGHHLYIDNFPAFNKAVLSVAQHLTDSISVVDIQQKPEPPKAEGGLIEKTLTE